jgi:hypothetical protein
MIALYGFANQLSEKEHMRGAFNDLYWFGDLRVGTVE